MNRAFLRNAAVAAAAFLAIGAQAQRSPASTAISPHSAATDDSYDYAPFVTFPGGGYGYYNTGYSPYAGAYGPAYGGYSPYYGGGYGPFYGGYSPFSPDVAYFPGNGSAAGNGAGGVAIADPLYNFFGAPVVVGNLSGPSQGYYYPQYVPQQPVQQQPARAAQPVAPPQPVYQPTYLDPQAKSHPTDLISQTNTAGTVVLKWTGGPYAANQITFALLDKGGRTLVQRTAGMPPIVSLKRPQNAAFYQAVISYTNGRQSTIIAPLK